MTRRLSPGARLVLATHNPGKVRELAEMLRPHGVEVVEARIGRGDRRELDQAIRALAEG